MGGFSQSVEISTLFLTLPLEHEVLVNVENHVRVTDFFHDTQNAMWKLLKFDPGIITYKLGSPTVSIPASAIQLNATLIYYLAILDPSLQFWADSPDIFPRSYQRLKENTNYLVNMKVQKILYTPGFFFGFSKGFKRAFKRKTDKN